MSSKKQLKARIRVLESDLATTRDLHRRHVAELDEAHYALDRVNRICNVITDRAVAGDPSAVDDFAWVTLTTPTLLMLAATCQAVLDKAATS